MPRPDDERGGTNRSGLGGKKVEQHVARARHGDGREPLALSSYVSALAARRLVGHHEPLREPEDEQLTAAVLFADISGFTALTDRSYAVGSRSDRRAE